MSFPSTVEDTHVPTLRAGSVRVTRQINASPDRVFDACLDAEEARTFLFAGRTGDAISSEIDPRTGGRFRVVRRWDGGNSEYSGEYLEIERPYRLVFSLFVERHAQWDDRVVVEFAPLEGKSLVVLTHEYSSPSQVERARIQSGWVTVLDRLAASCSESGPSLIRLPWLPAPAFAPWDADFV